MSVTNTGEALFQLVLIRGGLGHYIAAADLTLAAGSITAPVFFANGDWGAGQFSNKSWIVYRPGAASSADYVRYLSTLTPSTGLVAVDHNYSDTTATNETFYFLENGVHPSWVVDALNRGLDKHYVENIEPLSTKPAGSVLADAGHQSTATTQYTESDADAGPAMTISRVSTANSENVFQGIGAMRALNAAAGGYFRQRFSVTPGQQVMVHALSRLDSGTNAELVLYDVTNSAAIGTTVEHSQEAYQWMRRVDTIPTGCKIMEVRWQGEGTTDDVYWGGHSILFPELSRVYLDTKWDAAGKIPALVAAIPGGTSVSSNVYAAHATELVEIPTSDYAFLWERAGANPYAVQFHNNSQRHWFQYPIMIQGRRALSDLTTFTMALTETTSGETDLLDAIARVELFQDGRIRQRVSDADLRLAKAHDDLRAASRLLATTGPADRRMPLSFPRAGN